MRVDRRLLGWGVFFILLGAIPLAVRLGVLDESLLEPWFNLWPVLFIGWGLGLLLRGTPVEWIGGATAAIVFGVMGGSAIATGFGGVPAFNGCGTGDTVQGFQTQQGTLGSGGSVHVTFNCGELDVASADGDGWSVGGGSFNGRVPDVEASGADLSIEPPQTNNIFDAGRAEWNVVLPRAPSFGFSLTMNAGAADLHLDGANLLGVSFTLNAGSATIGLAQAATLGDLSATVNAGDGTISLPAGDRRASFTINAGRLHVCVPSGAAVRAHWSGALGSNNFASAGLTEVSEDVWETPGLAGDHLELQASANAGSFELEFGGTCHE